MSAEIVSRERLYDGWLTLDRVMVRMPDGEIVERHLEDHGAAVAVLPYDPARRVATLVLQPRTSVLDAGECGMLELPAGGVEDEAPEDAARRETREEAGIAVRDLELVTRMAALVTISTERMWIYLAAYSEADRVGAGGGAADENEAIEVVEVPLAELAATVAAGTLPDAKTLIAVQALMLRRPDLFSA